MKLVYITLFTFLFLCSCTFPGTVKLRKGNDGQWEAYEIETNNGQVDKREIQRLEDILNGN